MGMRGRPENLIILCTAHRCWVGHGGGGAWWDQVGGAGAGAVDAAGALVGRGGQSDHVHAAGKGLPHRAGPPLGAAAQILALCSQPRIDCPEKSFSRGPVLMNSQYGVYVQICFMELYNPHGLQGSFKLTFPRPLRPTSAARPRTCSSPITGPCWAYTQARAYDHGRIAAHAGGHPCRNPSREWHILYHISL